MERSVQGDSEKKEKILRVDRAHLRKQYSSQNVWLERKWYRKEEADYRHDLNAEL